MRFLGSLKLGLRNKIVRKLLKRPIRMMRDAVKAAAPVDSGALKMSIAEKIIVKGNMALGIVGVRNRWSVVKKGKVKIPNLYARIRYPQLKAAARVPQAKGVLYSDLKEALEALARGS